MTFKRKENGILIERVKKDMPEEASIVSSLI
jgi:hypothetical protein